MGELGEEKVCPFCGRGFCPQSLDQEFCSDVCEEEYAQMGLDDWLMVCAVLTGWIWVSYEVD